MKITPNRNRRCQFPTHPPGPHGISSGWHRLPLLWNSIAFFIVSGRGSHHVVTAYAPVPNSDSGLTLFTSSEGIANKNGQITNDAG